MNEREKSEVLTQFQQGTDSITESELDSVTQKRQKIFSLFRKIGKNAEDFKILWNLLNDYKNGTYKAVPWKLIAAVVFAFVYLLSPLDVIPDVIPVLGLTDDISVFGLVLAGFATEIEAYKNWCNAKIDCDTIDT